MPKAKPKQDDKEQSKRFVEKAKEIKAEKDDGVFDRVLNKILPPKRRQKSNH